MAGNPPERRDHWTRGLTFPKEGQRYTGVQVRSTLYRRHDHGGGYYVVGEPGAHVTWDGEAHGTWKSEDHRIPDPATDIIAAGTGGGPGFDRGKEYLAPHSLILHHLDQNNPEASTRAVVSLHTDHEFNSAQHRQLRRKRAKEREEWEASKASKEGTQ